ncbi:RNA polymerase sigma factor SigJ [Amnibacterium flavum]|uniref:RNA polymerase subunit sigma-24 n=1 Tax=Amnibacterium flavum TaxID=2173173 RepID=A0A2V1HPE2_9MICO|nr:RNA polymerase sigma factor SigJ [Amnibacterium flavum]PVZ94503.1 RNA polymerase subunit sigma-24 [Amnibacterium flavum]
MSDGPADDVSDRTGDDPYLGERRHLLGVAYRMLGTLHDAEDAVQDAFARWYRLTPGERAAIAVPGAWLTKVTGRIALDMLGSARARRERYVGEWLPEPVPATALTSASHSGDPLDAVAHDDSVSMALLVVLESLTPAERVAFVLHDVFAVPFDEIAEIVGRTPQACRTLASSARRSIRDRRERESGSAAHRRVIEEFWAASRSGRLDALIAVLDPDVVTRSDGGGKVSAALNPVRGADRVARFLLGILAKQSELVATLEPVGDRTGFVFRRDGVVTSVVTANVRGDVVTDVWIVLNPDKLDAWNRQRE